MKYKIMSTRCEVKEMKETGTKPSEQRKQPHSQRMNNEQIFRNKKKNR